MNARIVTFDKGIIATLKRYHDLIARVAIFIVFFWFGLLKITGDSPASPLVQHLFEKTITGIPFDTFLILFGLYEMIIGVLFLIPKAERAAIALLIPHLIATVSPLLLLPETTWSHPLIPTMEGQYILKNMVILALAVSIAANLHPFKLDKKPKK